MAVYIGSKKVTDPSKLSRSDRVIYERATNPEYAASYNKLSATPIAAEVLRQTGDSEYSSVTKITPASYSGGAKPGLQSTYTTQSITVQEMQPETQSVQNQPQDIPAQVTPVNNTQMAMGVNIPGVVTMNPTAITTSGYRPQVGPVSVYEQAGPVSYYKPKPKPTSQTQMSAILSMRTPGYSTKKPDPLFGPDPTLLVRTSPTTQEKTAARIGKWDTAAAGRAERFDKLVSTVTLGGGKPSSERSFIGRGVQNVISGSRYTPAFYGVAVSFVEQAAIKTSYIVAAVRSGDIKISVKPGGGIFGVTPNVTTSRQFKYLQSEGREAVKQVYKQPSTYETAAEFALGHASSNAISNFISPKVPDVKGDGKVLRSAEATETTEGYNFKYFESKTKGEEPLNVKPVKQSPFEGVRRGAREAYDKGKEYVKDTASDMGREGKAYAKEKAQSAWDYFKKSGERSETSKDLSLKDTGKIDTARPDLRPRFNVIERTRTPPPRVDTSLTRPTRPKGGDLDIFKGDERGLSISDIGPTDIIPFDKGGGNITPKGDDFFYIEEKGKGGGDLTKPKDDIYRETRIERYKDTYVEKVGGGGGGIPIIWPDTDSSLSAGGGKVPSFGFRRRPSAGRRAYMPSVSAQLFNIRGPRPGQITGLEQRPILGKSRIKKKDRLFRSSIKWF